MEKSRQRLTRGRGEACLYARLHTSGTNYLKASRAGVRGVVQVCKTYPLTSCEEATSFIT